RPPGGDRALQPRHTVDGRHLADAGLGIRPHCRLRMAVRDRNQAHARNRVDDLIGDRPAHRSEEHTSELSHRTNSYAVFCLKKKNALETLAYDPQSFLVLPRVLAGTTMFPVIVALAILPGIFTGLFASFVLLDLSTQVFLTGL